MGNDERQSKEPGRETFETVPPELRPYFAPGPTDSIDVAKNPRLAAALAGIAMLDEMEEAKRREAAAHGGEKVHVPPVVIPAAALPLPDTAERIKVSVPVLGARPLVPADPTLVSSAASPWVKPGAAEVRESALPSSLRPREREAPASTKPTAAPRNRKMAAVWIVIAVVALGLGVRALTTRGPENAAPGLPSTTAAPPPPPEKPPALPASVDSPAPMPAPSGAIPSVPPQPNTPAPPSSPVAPRPRPRGAEVDPYADASAPKVPAPTPSSAAPAITAAPVVTSAPTTAPAVTAPKPASTLDKPNYD